MKYHIGFGQSSAFEGWGAFLFVRAGQSCVVTCESAAAISPALCAVLLMRILRKGSSHFLEVRKSPIHPELGHLLRC